MHAFWALIENGARVQALELGGTLATLPGPNLEAQVEAIYELVRQHIDLLWKRCWAQSFSNARRC
jgi:hypothetical protein